MTPFLKYTLKVWQTAVFATPVIFYLFTLFQTPSIIDSLRHIQIGSLLLMFLLMVIIGMILSVPSALLLWWTTDLVIKYANMDATYQKALLCLIGVVLTFGPFLLLDYGGTLNGGDCYLCLFYAMTIGVGIWLYDPYPESEDYIARQETV